MKKIILIAFIISITLSCSSSKTNYDYRNDVGYRVKTRNPHTPYIYENGYKNFKIKPVFSIQNNELSHIHELRFYAVYSAMYTKKLMYEKYGKWDEEVWLDGSRTPILIWNNRKLIESSDELYSVAANGTESMDEIFASVIVTDSKDRDALAANYVAKDSLIKYFAYGIKNLSGNDEFYELHRKRVEAHRRTK